jgi:chromosome segregation ATPase
MTSNPIHKLDTELSKWAQLRAVLTNENLTEQELLDCMEGETDLREAISALSDALLDDETRLAGLDATITRLEARALRYRKRMETARKVIQKAMEQAGVRKLELPEATLSIGRTPQGVVIFEEAAIPDEYWIEQKPKLNKAAIKSDLKAGKNVVGATLDNGASRLTIRRS